MILSKKNFSRNNEGGWVGTKILKEVVQTVEKQKDVLESGSCGEFVVFQT